MSSSYQARGYQPRVSLYPRATQRPVEERAPASEPPAAAQTGPLRDNSLLGRWWWSVDRWTLGAIFLLIGFGYIMMLAASPAVAERIGTSRDIFIFKQVFFLAVAAGVVFGVSLLSPRDIRRLAIVGCLIALALTAATMVIGIEIKGARRWISLPGMSVQPSEFLKPCFAVVAAWLLAEGKKSPRFPGMILAGAVFALILLLLKSQPDIGMLAVVTTVFLAQLYIGGLPLALVGVAVGMMGTGAVSAYVLFPHVQSRVNRFWEGTGDNYQVTTALEAFGNGGLLGRGPGEGRVKDILPDAHADFVFAVAGEEFGMILCCVIIGVFAFIVLRGLLRLLKEHDPFIVLACTGLVTGFGLQAFVNMASTLKLIPTKGMTLPFISYGGSSALAVALGMGMLLALTRKRGRDEPR
jgi:cell division protein FtsW